MGCCEIFLQSQLLFLSGRYDRKIQRNSGDIQRLGFFLQTRICRKTRPTRTRRAEPFSQHIPSLFLYPCEKPDGYAAGSRPRSSRRRRVRRVRSFRKTTLPVGFFPDGKDTRVGSARAFCDTARHVATTRIASSRRVNALFATKCTQLVLYAQVHCPSSTLWIRGWQWWFEICHKRFYGYACPWLVEVWKISCAEHPTCGLLGLSLCF